MRFWFAYWSVVLVTTLGGSSQSLFAGDAPPAWQLHPAVQVGLVGAYLDELFVNPSALPPHIRLASSCITYGQTVSFTRAQVADLLREHAPELVLSNWIGPSQIKITRRKRQLDETE